LLAKDVIKCKACAVIRLRFGLLDNPTDNTGCEDEKNLPNDHRRFENMHEFNCD